MNIPKGDIEDQCADAYRVATVRPGDLSRAPRAADEESDWIEADEFEEPSENEWMEGGTTLEDAPLNVSSPGPLANDVDLDGDSLTAVLVSGPTRGTVSLAASGSFLYTPGHDFAGMDSFTYRVSHGTTKSA